MAELRVERVHGPARRAIGKGLRAYNTASAGKSGFQPLTITVRDRGKIVGGLAAETFFGWMFISLLWVDERYRRDGVGTSLIARAEAEARARGMTGVWLDTHTFQAPGFYKKMGYRRFAELKDFPAGHSRVWFSKRLPAARQDREAPGRSPPRSTLIKPRPRSSRPKPDTIRREPFGVV